MAACSCTYTVCFYGVCTLAFAPTVFINTQRLPSQIDINHQLLTSSFVQHILALLEGAFDVGLQVTWIHSS
jgi:hypothetical protein